MTKAGGNIITVNLNPCIDWQYSVPGFTFGGMNRVLHTRQDASGKGMNVCMALKNLGLDPLCTGFNFTENGVKLTERLDALEIRHNFIEVAGAVRVNIKLYEESSGVMTELNQPGAFVDEHAQEKLADYISRTGGQFLILSGSRPAGVSAIFYAHLCKSWPGKVFLDTEGEAFRLAVNTAPPFAVKPNLFELESTFGVELKSPREIADFCRRKLVDKGICVVCCSMGADGAVLVTDKLAYFCPVLDIEAKSVQGAGDAMVAGMVYATYMGTPTSELLPTAMAAAAASVIQDGTEMCTREGFDEMLKKVPNIKPL